MALLDSLGDPFNLRLFDYSSCHRVNGQMVCDDAHNVFALVANNITLMINAAAMAIFVIVFVIGGLMYITSNGNPQRVDSAKKYLTFSVIGLLVIILAQFITNTSVYIVSNFAMQNSIANAIQTVTDYLVGITGALATIFIIIGGIKYMTARGNTQQVDSAKKTLTYAIVGLVAVIMSYFVGTLILHITVSVFS